MKTMKRILALGTVFIILLLVVFTLYCAFTGSPYFMASLFSMIVLPVVLYGYMSIYRVMAGRKQELKELEEKLKKEKNEESKKDLE